MINIRFVPRDDFSFPYPITNVEHLTYILLRRTGRRGCVEQHQVQTREG